MKAAFINSIKMTGMVAAGISVVVAIIGAFVMLITGMMGGSWLAGVGMLVVILGIIAAAAFIVNVDRVTDSKRNESMGNDPGP